MLNMYVCIPMYMYISMYASMLAIYHLWSLANKPTLSCTFSIFFPKYRHSKLTLALIEFCC